MVIKNNPKLSESQQHVNVTYKLPTNQNNNQNVINENNIKPDNNI